MEETKSNIILSIIIPVYKVERFLERCFESLERQTKKDNIEIIFVNDGSPDHSGYMCDVFAEGKPNIRVIHKKNGGLSDARNSGIDMARGEYCMFLDSDDTIKSDACEKICTYLKQQTVDVLYLDVNWIDKKKSLFYGKRGFPKEKILSGEEALALEFCNSKFVAIAPVGIYNLNFLKKNNLYFKKGILHEDEQWTPRVMMQAQQIIRKEYAFYNYYIREGSITQKKDKKRYTDLIDTIHELSALYEKSKDKRIKIYGGQYLASLYMNAFVNLKAMGISCKLEKRFLISRTHGIKNKCKLFLFLFTPKIYLKMIG